MTPRRTSLPAPLKAPSRCVSTGIDALFHLFDLMSVHVPSSNPHLVEAGPPAKCVLSGNLSRSRPGEPLLCISHLRIRRLARPRQDPQVPQLTRPVITAAVKALWTSVLTVCPHQLPGQACSKAQSGSTRYPAALSCTRLGAEDRGGARHKVALVARSVSLGTARLQRRPALRALAPWSSLGVGVESTSRRLSRRSSRRPRQTSSIWYSPTWPHTPRQSRRQWLLQLSGQKA